MNLERQPWGIFRKSNYWIRDTSLYCKAFCFGSVVTTCFLVFVPLVEATCSGCTQCLQCCTWSSQLSCCGITRLKSKAWAERQWVSDYYEIWCALYVIIICTQCMFHTLLTPSHSYFTWMRQWQLDVDVNLVAHWSLFLFLFQSRNSLFVCSVPKTATEEDVKTHFSWVEWNVITY